MNIVHVAFDGHFILLDTGVGEPYASRSSLTRSFPLQQTESLVHRLDAIGVSPQQITTVVFSHVHCDHIMGSTVDRDGRRVACLPNARDLLMRPELDRRPRAVTARLAFQPPSAGAR